MTEKEAITHRDIWTILVAGVPWWKLNTNAFEAYHRWLVDCQLDGVSKVNLVQLFVRQERYPRHGR
jgi:hypothetical protein